MLKTVGLGKQYEATVALSGLDLEIEPGQVIGIVGENGAGKSTFMKLLAGIVTPTSGQIIVDGKAVHVRDTRTADSLGIQMVHQELNLIPTLSVEDNIFLGQEIGSAFVDRTKTRARASELLHRVGARFDPGAMCESLSIAEQQLVEIAKALSKKARIIIFDEPTAVLSEVESEKLFEIISNLKAEGTAVLYVSHRLPEVLAICDRIVVFRDGEKVAEKSPKDLTEMDLANLMVGRKLEDVFPAKNQPSDHLVLEVHNLVVPGFANGISFGVRQAEILGLAGLIGSGRTETCEAIMGFRSGNGQVVVDGKPLKGLTYEAASGAGIAYVSEDRKGKGLIVDMTIEENISLASLSSQTSVSKRLQTAREWIENLKIKVPNAQLPMTSLSGGNQQKCSVAKWLQTKPKAIVLDEPTRGIDVGSKAEMYKLIGELAETGLACVVISSEMPELIGLCHRVLVFREGQIVGELTGPSITEENIMAFAAGVKGEAA